MFSIYFSQSTLIQRAYGQLPIHCPIHHNIMPATLLAALTCTLCLILPLMVHSIKLTSAKWPGQPRLSQLCHIQTKQPQQQKQNPNSQIEPNPEGKEACRNTKLGSSTSYSSLQVHNTTCTVLYNCSYSILYIRTCTVSSITYRFHAVPIMNHAHTQ